MGNVERLAPYTGKNPVPAPKAEIGFKYEKDKYDVGHLSPEPSISVKPTRISECPLQIEAKVMNIRIPEYDPKYAIVETQSLNVHAHEELIIDNDHIDPKKWSPLIYNFRHYFGLDHELGKTFRAET
ncbi:hypothetical protein SAMN05216362_104149 [Piscibacillus halophilus]|uniref:Uncharacterized protein n=1 Tax=Piscibacillus halophilus TaxID=571933 RepID=A0A1H9C0E9_9BACI|nr:hypothetical protein SAMN05216362_104149 [Piscibacillus halophilus]